MAPRKIGELDHNKLLRLLNYNPETGVLTRAVTTSSRAKEGDVAGDLDGKGYLRLCVAGKRYLAHRVAWFYHYGEWPSGELDHINGQTTDNRIENLREASRAQNLWNTRMHSTNRQGMKGVSVSCSGKKYRARIFLNGKEKHLGVFTTVKEANAAYEAAARKNFGEFARAS